MEESLKRNENVEQKEELFKRKIKTKLEEIKSKAIKDISQQMVSMMDEVVQEIDAPVNGTKIYHKENGVSGNNGKIILSRDSKLELPEKEFIARNSILTDLYKQKHLSTVYNLFAAICIVLAVHTFTNDYITKGRINLAASIIYYGFENFHMAFFVWFSIYLTVLIQYVCFTIWATTRMQIRNEPKKCKGWDYTWLAGLIIYYLALLYVTPFFVAKIKMGYLSGLILLTEEVRFLMKMHAFLRTNVPRVTNFKSPSARDMDMECKEQPYSEFSKYLYFLWAPTMIYRDEYPRNDKIRWDNVAKYAIEFVAIVFFMALIADRYFVPTFRDTCKSEPVTASEIILKIVSSSIPALMTMMAAFYGLLHVWLNGFAELLTFADRMFYLDWWTSTNQGRFLRTWNVIIQDWLYQYVYKDCYQYVVPRNKNVAKASVVLLSAIFHEYILSAMMGFFMPIVFFGLSSAAFVASLFLDRSSFNRPGNISFLVLFTIGNSPQICLFVMELYARINYPVEDAGWNDFFVPRFFTCHTRR